MAAGPLVEQTSVDQPPALALEAGAYEIIRQRLDRQASDLRSKLDQLNQLRKQVFGTIDTTLLATERITTEHNCVPRDLVAVGQRLLVGFNVHFGFKTEVSLPDVFSAYVYRDKNFHHEPLDFLSDPRFVSDFQELYKYYRHTVFAKFAVRGPHLFMVFRIGKSTTEIKTFKWSIHEDHLTYIDNRSDHEFRYPPQHAFTWTRTTRDMHHYGKHPHISIEDRIFVETVGGDLTIKVENNTDSGEGVYSEPVDKHDQLLDDAEIHYASLGDIILLKIRPYQEKETRHIAYSAKLHQARRLDMLQHACQYLPGDQGIIFANGCFLQSGEHKTFETNVPHLLFESHLSAPNGEDHLYVYYNRENGIYVMLPYNVIEQQVGTPILCNGYAFLDNGEMINFKGREEPQKHHAIQIWQTPFVGPDVAPSTHSDSYLYKVGNRDLVQGMAECHEILNLLTKQDTYADLYRDLIQQTSDTIDSYFWISHPDACNLKSVLSEIHHTATSAVNEFDKVTRLRRNTQEQIQLATQKTKQIIQELNARRFEVIDDFVKTLMSLRGVRGELISLRELRYADMAQIDKMEQEVSTETERTSQRCVDFLLSANALEPYLVRLQEQESSLTNISKVSEAKQLEAEITAGANELEMLVDIVSNLKIDDATQRTTIIDNISVLFSQINKVRATLKTTTRQLAQQEGAAEFHAQVKLFHQSIVNYLDVCDTPEKCDEYLTKIMVQLEELEGKFAEFDDFILALAEKRDEAYSAFEARKLSLVEARNKRSDSLMAAAQRILASVKTRVASLDTVAKINGYFASDLMIDKVRDVMRELTSLGESVKVDDLQSRLKTLKEDAVRQLKDKQELFADGAQIIRLGKHQFSVNTQTLDLTTITREGEMYLHLTGTQYMEQLVDPELLSRRSYWDLQLISESPAVYRAEYLAWILLQSIIKSDQMPLPQVAEMDLPACTSWVQKWMAARYQEGYVKGVHDHDAALLIKGLVRLHLEAGLLRYPSDARALAWAAWKYGGKPEQQKKLAARLRAAGAVKQTFPQTQQANVYQEEVEQWIQEFQQSTSLFNADLVTSASQYFTEQLSAEERPVASRQALELCTAFREYLHGHGRWEAFQQSLAHVSRDWVGNYHVRRDWLAAFQQANQRDDGEFLDEAVWLLGEKTVDDIHILEAPLVQTISGLLGNHPRVDQGSLTLRANEFSRRLQDHCQRVIPNFEQFQQLKRDLVARAKQQMRLKEFMPRVLTSFVRNKLIDQVYLPLIGDNLAKQIGVIGEKKRTDLMGLLLLISPPGYGKTTLMEYVANRLGLIFMKINGPSIGHRVTSLDPAEAPNAAARQEIEKLNLAFEMGDNVLIYLDDIQHCNPELLQKFISLCDGQRKIEGVYQGKTRTYDLRGRKVAVAMAGNPYTESGEKFRIPDMLANRADTYNLGDVIGDTWDVFRLSYLENALTSNPVLNQLASRSTKDIYAVIQWAESGSREGLDFEAHYAPEELQEMYQVMCKLVRIRDVVLKVNQQYIRSASQSDDYRTEPPFLLQGSYRNMNKMAEKVAAMMNDEELESLIDAHYQGEVQTLTTNAEANWLKYRELVEKQTGEETKRWEQIKSTFSRNTQLRGMGDDKLGQAILQLTVLSESFRSLRDVLVGVFSPGEDDTSKPANMTQGLSSLQQMSSALQSLAARQMPDRVTATLESGMVDRLEKALMEAKPNGEGEALQSRIQVVNKLPDTMVNILEHQFLLMHKWLAPLLNASVQQQAVLGDLRDQMQEVLGHYEKLLGKLSSAQHDEE